MIKVTISRTHILRVICNLSIYRTVYIVFNLMGSVLIYFHKINIYSLVIIITFWIYKIFSQTCAVILHACLVKFEINCTNPSRVKKINIRICLTFVSIQYKLNII